MDETLSEQEKYANYKMLMEVLSDTHPTPEWISKHRDFIIDMRKFFPSFCYIRVMSDDKDIIAELSENSRRCEVLMQNLIESISLTGTYDLVVYRLFAQNLEPLVRQHIPDEDLAELLGKMQM